MNEEAFIRPPLPKGEAPISRDDIAATIMQARMEILRKYPLDKSLAEILQSDPEPRLRDTKDILASISGESLQLDQIFDLEKAKAMWEEEKAANQAARDAELSKLEINIGKVTTATVRRIRR